MKHYLADEDYIFGKALADDLVNEETGEVIAECGTIIDLKLLENLDDVQILLRCWILIISMLGHGCLTQWKLIKTGRREEALIDIYRIMRPGEPPTYEAAEALFNGLFFDPERYDLSAVGRVKINNRLDLDCSDEMRVLRKEDILHICENHS